MKFISESSKNFAGIYCILNTVTGKFYIGSTINFWTRYKVHRNELRKHQHSSIYLNRSYDKYGHDAFEFHILEIMDVSDVKTLREREQRYLDTLCPHNKKVGYNMSRSALSVDVPGIGARIAAIRKKNGSYGHSEESRVKCGNGRRGKKHTQAHKNHMSKILSGRVRSEQHKTNNGKAIRKPILAFDWLGYPIASYESLINCAKFYGINKASMCAHIGSGKEYKGAFLVYLSRDILRK